MNYYQVLGVTPFSSNEEVESAYRDIISNFSSNELSDEDLKRKADVEKAYVILSDHHSRTVYDDQMQEDNEILATRSDLSDFKSKPKEFSNGQNLWENGNQSFDSLHGNSDFQNLLLKILTKLEDLEKKVDEINDDKINFYKEKKIIETKIKRNGEKVSTTKTTMNENGNITETKQLVIYDSKGKIIKTYFGDNIKKKF